MVLEYPDLAARSCDDCERFLYRQHGPVIMGRRNPLGVLEPMRRPPAMPTPCRDCPKIPAGMPPKRESAVDMNERVWRVYQHYLECRAIGKFPNDPIVRRNASLIRMTTDRFERHDMTERVDRLIAATVNKG